jgi:hypothetical protein
LRAWGRSAQSRTIRIIIRLLKRMTGEKFVDAPALFRNVRQKPPPPFR